MNTLTKVLDEAYELYTEKKFEASLERLQEAEIYLEENNSLIPQDKLNDVSASVNNFKGFNYLSIANADKAKTCFENAINMNPNSSQACAGLAEIFYINGLDKEAKVMFEWAIDNNPSNKFAVTGLAKSNTQLGLPENHNTLNLAAVFTVEGKNFVETLTEAYELFRNNRFEESLQLIEKGEQQLNESHNGTDRSNQIASLENFKGFNMLALNRKEEARKRFENGLQINPSSSQSCAGLAELFFLEGKDEEAKAMYEWSVVNNPNNQFALAGLGKVNRLNGLPSAHNTLIK